MRYQILAIVAAAILLGPISSFAQNQIDIDLLGKADTIMAKAKTAGQAEVSDLMSQLMALSNTKGLSAPCRAAFVTMHSAISMKIPDDQLSGMPDGMKQTFKTQEDANAKEIEAKRAACLQAAQNDSDAAAVTPDQPGAAVALHDKLASLRDEAKSYFEAGDATGLERVQTVLAGIGRQQDQDMNCRLAATNMVQEITGYTKVLGAQDDKSKQIGMAKVKISAALVDTQLNNCE